MTDSNIGSFVWYDLMTTDPAAAIAFYTHVAGWKTEPFKMEGGGDDHYTMWVSEQGPLGGVVTLPESARKMGAPPHWMANVEVADVDATVAKVRKLEGSVHVEPQDIPTVGRFAVIADPHGASISVFKPLRPMPPQDGARAGSFCWSELMSADHNVAFRFYAEIFGWEKAGEHDMGPMGQYLLFGHGDKQIGGMMTKPKEMPVSAWMYYLNVGDLDAAVERAKAKGAKLMNGPMPIPGGSRIAQLTDPQGAWFALLGAA
jgi:uncharacterized protein